MLDSAAAFCPSRLNLLGDRDDGSHDAFSQPLSSTLKQYGGETHSGEKKKNVGGCTYTPIASAPSIDRV